MKGIAAIFAATRLEDEGSAGGGVEEPTSLDCGRVGSGPDGRSAVDLRVASEASGRLGDCAPLHATATVRIPKVSKLRRGSRRVVSQPPLLKTLILIDGGQYDSDEVVAVPPNDVPSALPVAFALEEPTSFAAPLKQLPDPDAMKHVDTFEPFRMTVALPHPAIPGLHVTEFEFDTRAHVAREGVPGQAEL